LEMGRQFFGRGVVVLRNIIGQRDGDMDHISYF
jgi:hypothetical protein